MNRNITTTEASEQLDISVRRVQALAKTRSLGKKIGRDLLFTQAEIEKLKERKPGRPVTIKK